MSTFTPNYNLEKPDSTDDFKDFRQSYNDNMDKIDQNMGGGGSVNDVTVNGSSVVNNGVAEITEIDNVMQTSSMTLGDNDNDLRGELKLQSGSSVLPATATIRTNLYQLGDATFQLPTTGGTLALEQETADYLSVVGGKVNITYYTL